MCASKTPHTERTHYEHDARSLVIFGVQRVSLCPAFAKKNKTTEHVANPRLQAVERSRLGPASGERVQGRVSTPAARLWQLASDLIVNVGGILAFAGPQIRHAERALGAPALRAARASLQQSQPSLEALCKPGSAAGLALSRQRAGHTPVPWQPPD